jgi:dolichyl-phosphate-mannose-protein mannosyltransferase
MRISRLAASITLGALAAVGTVAITSGAGPGLDPDSMSYMQAASSFLRGGGLRDVQRDWASVDSTMPLSHWPPGFPLALAGAERLGIDATWGARALNAISAFVTIGGITWLVGDAAGLAAGLVAGLLVMVTPAVVQVHENVLSEPLFIALLVLTLVTMVRARTRPLVSGTLAGLASIVRYAGLSVVGGAVLWQLARAGTLRERMTRALTAALPGIVLQGAWVTRTVHKSGPGSIREISWYGELGPTLREGWHTVSVWLVPGMSEVRSAFLAICVVLLLLVTIWKVRPARAEQTAHAAGLLAACYVALLLVSRLVADLTIPLDDRLMAPLFLLLEVALVVMVAPAWRSWPMPVKVLAVGLGTLWWGSALLVSRESARYAVQTGNDLADTCWRRSPLLAWVRANGSGHALYTNVPEALFFRANRLSHEFPEERNAKAAGAFLDTLVRRNALIVEFDATCMNVDNPDTLLARMPVHEVVTLPTGRVLAPLEPLVADTFRARQP